MDNGIFRNHANPLIRLIMVQTKERKAGPEMQYGQGFTGLNVKI